MVVGLLSVLFFLLGFLWVPGPGLCLTKWTNWSISVDLLVAAETGLHGRGLLLVSEGRRVGQRGDGGVVTKLRLGEAEVTKYGGVLAGHGEEGILLWGRQRQAGAGDGLLSFSARHRPGI